MKKGFKSKLLVGLLATSLVATGCEFIVDDGEKTEQEEIYLLAKEAGYEGTYEEWLASIKGEKGDPGKDGATWYTGETTPGNTLGKVGDFYIDTSTKKIYVKETSGWVLKTTIEDGREVEFRKTTTHIEWKYTSEDEESWRTLVSLDDIKGNVGENGDPGKDGSTILNGNSIPSNELGENGDYYLNVLTNILYQKENNTWKQISNPDFIYGDVNRDKEINLEDAKLLGDYLNKKAALSTFAIRNADVDLDGEVTGADKTIIEYYIANEIDSLPVEVTYGDVNLDGNVDEEDYQRLFEIVAGYSATVQEKLNADYNKDGELNNKDATNFAQALYSPGDINFDEKIDEEDVELLEKHLNEDITLAHMALYNADVDTDGEITGADKNILEKYLAGEIESLPVEALYGDANLDGNVDEEDYQRLFEIAAGYSATVQEKLNADYNKDGELNNKDVTNFAQALYSPGDINFDEKIDEEDVDLLEKHLNEDITLAYMALYNADVDTDGEVTGADKTIIEYYIANEIDSLPVEVTYGDANLDGKIDAEDQDAIRKIISDGRIAPVQQMLNSDYDKNGKVTLWDVILLGWSFKGDVNLDSKVNEEDLLFMESYLDGEIEESALTEAQKEAMDLDLDGEITGADKNILEKYLSGEIESLPVKTLLYGDANLDGVISEEDANLIQKYTAQFDTLTTIQQKLNADFDKDGEITIKDSIAIKVYLYNPGDANLDESVDSLDLETINKHLNEELTLNGLAKNNADLDLDTEITLADKNILAKYLNGDLESLEVTVNYGDVNLDGSITEEDANVIDKYLAGSESLSQIQLLNADMNKDGEITIKDSIAILTQLYMKGDVDKNLVVDGADLESLNAYLNEEGTLSKLASTNADVDDDGEVTGLDKLILEFYLNGELSSLSVTVTSMDVNLDGEITVEDATLVQEYSINKIELDARQVINADANKDGQINTVDAAMIDRYVAGETEQA